MARFLEENGDLRMEPFTVRRFVLLSARPGSGGGPYVVEAAYPFEGEDDGAIHERTALEKITLPQLFEYLEEITAAEPAAKNSSR